MGCIGRHHRRKKMKTTIKEMREKSDFLHHMMIKSVTRLGTVNEVWPEFPADGKWDITLTMNGVELPIVEAFEELKESLDINIREEAMNIIHDKFFDLDETLNDLIANAKRKFAEKLGVHIEEY